MNGRNDPYAEARRTQAQMWPSARRVVLVGKNYYPAGRDDEDE